MSNKNNSTRNHSEKTTVPGKSSFLENAILNLSSLLGQNLNDHSNEIPPDSPALRTIDLKDEDIDQYISTLADRLLKVQESLTREESLLFKEQEENIDLKAKWSEEVKKQENTVRLGKSEIIRLSDQNKDLVSEMHGLQKEKELLLKEIEKVDGEIEKARKEGDKYKSLQQAYSQKNEKQLKAELQETKDLMRKELELKASQEKNMEHLKKEMGGISDFIESCEVKSRQIKEKIEKLRREKNSGDDKDNKFLSDYKSSSVRRQKLDQKLEELDLIIQKFEDEIVLKNQQLKTSRKKNQSLEIKWIKYETLRARIALESEIKAAFTMEKEMLVKHLEKLIQDGKSNPIAKDPKLNEDRVLEVKGPNGLSNPENFIDELKSSHKSLNNLYDKFIDLPLDKFEEYYQILQENIRMEEMVQDLEIKLAQKNAVIDDFDKENKFVKYENARIMNKMEEIKLGKAALLEKYSLLEKEMKGLSVKEKLEKVPNKGTNEKNGEVTAKESPSKNQKVGKEREKSQKGSNKTEKEQGGKKKL